MNQLLEEKEETSWKVEEMRQTAGGAYARQMIQRIIQGFKDRNVMEGEGNPYQDMEETLDLIYSDS